MRKCRKCNIVFHSEKRLNCLYCDDRLIDVDKDAVVVQKASQGSVEKKPEELKKDVFSHERMQYLVGSYFRTKTLSFLYNFSRNELKRGKSFKRFLVQPLNYSFIIKLPWIFVDIIDSLLFRLVHSGYCLECGWKYQQVSKSAKHDPKECEYNREYTRVLVAIFNGSIIRNESEFEKEAKEKKKQNKKSAYYDLCTAKKSYGAALDVATILVSIGVILYVITKLVTPIFGDFYDFYDL